MSIGTHTLISDFLLIDSKRESAMSEHPKPLYIYTDPISKGSISIIY